MSAADIIQAAGSQMLFLAPALLVFAGLAFADSITSSLIRVVKTAARQYRL